MKWKKYRLKTMEDAEDIVIATLYDCGIEGAEIEDKKPLTAEEKEQMFVDILPDLPDDDGVAYLNFYLDPDETDTDAVLQKAKEALDELRSYTDIGEGTIEESETEDKDWINNWKQYFKQFYVDDILIIPSWEQVKEEDRDKMILHIDPGTAFGTGMHETTQLCIRQLRKYVKPGMEILDVGTGSGILGIVAVKFGAGHVLGTDLDPCAVPAVEDNRKANDVPNGAFDMIIGNMIDDSKTRDRAGYEKYDIVTANILADILVPMTPAVVPAMKKGCLYITSGILEDQADKVLDACKAAGLEIVEQTQQGEWVSITARKMK
ncbi:MAG: 50S ribosomal protein L11 methyltransferase [Lachnospiraceae bacterium]|nr:50S ribosomal protein L11 methyltransferase [Lachnospiraceae bacterium]